MLAITDGEGKAWTSTFDGADRLLTRTDPTEVVTTYQYVEDGSIDDSRLGSGQGHTVVTQVGPSGLGIITRTTTDGLGRPYSTIHPAGDTGKNRVSTMDYDIQTSLGNSSPILNRSTARNGRIAETTVDGLSRTLKTETDPGSGSHLAIATTYTYDDNSNLLTITDAKSQVTTYTYNSRNLQTAETYHDGNGWSYGYDRSYRLTSATDGRGVAKAITYDKLSRPTTVSYSGITHGADTFVYTDSELKVEARTAEYNNNCISSFDVAGREVSCEHQFGAVPGTTINEKYTCSSTYDRQGNLTACVNPSGQTVSSTYDNAARMLTKSLGSVTSVAQTYDGAGRLSTKFFASGKGESFTYNGNSWITSIAHTFTESGTNNGGLTFTYTFDASGLPLTKSFSRDSNRNETYTYDAADRLASNTRGIPGSQSWSLDKLGNWNSVTTDSVVQNRDHSVLTPGPQNGLNEITALKDASNNVTDNLSYDDAGNLTAITPVSGTARSFAWDANSRLKTWVKGSTTIGYEYDAYGRRVSDGERRYIYCHGWRVCEERDLSNPQTDATDGSLTAMPLLKTLVYGNYLDEVVQYDTKVNPSYNTAPSSNWDGRGDSGYDASWTDAKTNEQVYSRTYHIHCDQIYSAKALTNSAGELVEYYDYLAYGFPTIYKSAGTDGIWFTTDDIISTDSGGSPGSSFSNLCLFTEQIWLQNVNTYFFKNRFYIPNLGRFANRDPYNVASGQLNLFEYVSGSPVNYSDPLGLFKPENHKKATEDGLAKSVLSKKCIKIIVDADVAQDDGAWNNSGPFADSANHGDGGVPGIKAAINKIVERWYNIEAIKECKCCEDVDTSILKEFGKILHGLQDLYAHSNYVEVMDKAGGGKSKVGDIQIWQMFAQPGNTPNIPPGVVTGNYVWSAKQLFNDDDTAYTPAPTHYQMNKDNKDSLAGKVKNNAGTSMFDLALDVATRHTTVMWGHLSAQMADNACWKKMLECCKKKEGE